MYKLGYPFFKWNLEYYLEAVYHSMISIYHCTDKKTVSKPAFDYVKSMTEAIGLVDFDMESVVYQSSGELFSLFDLVQLFTTKEN